MLATLVLLISVCVVYTVKGDAAPIGSVPMRVVNNAGVSIELYWNDIFSVQSGEDMKLVLQSSKPIRNSSDTTINSYNTHEFVVRFLKHVEGGPQARFTKGPHEETVNIHYDAATKTMSAVQRTKFDELMDKVKEATISCDDYIGDRYADCISQLVIKDISKITESKDIIASYRDIMSNRLRNYICSDLSANITQSLKNTTYTDKNSHTFGIQNVLDSSHAKIWMIDNFMTETECQALQTHHHAHMTESSSSVIPTAMSRVSNATFSLENGDDEYDHNHSAIIKALHHRVTALYNHKTISGHTAGAVGALESDGQEEIHTQHYQSQGERVPQCDYDCEGRGGRFIEEAERVATIVLHCQTPTVGGLMVLPKADAILRPKPYSAVVISYIGSDGRMDEGISQRSECPVMEGEKFQAIIHLRHTSSTTSSNKSSPPDHSLIPEKQESHKQAEGKVYRSQFAKYNDLHKEDDIATATTTATMTSSDEEEGDDEDNDEL